MKIAILSLVPKSLANRRITAGLTIIAIAVSVAMLLSVERLRQDARDGFANTISGTDLIVGARSGEIQLLLYSVFRIGNATNNVSWQSYQKVAADPAVAWTIPLSLGDSHRGYRVLGTNQDYFKHYQFGRRRHLAFASGAPFEDLFDAVIGAEVAENLGYQIGTSLIISHGLGRQGFADHGDRPFRVAGILTRTGTPIDRTVHVSLGAIEAIHVDWKNDSRIRGFKVSPDQLRNLELEPRSITAFLVGLKSRLGAFHLQRVINNYGDEPLMAVFPGVALQNLWSVVGVAETALTGIAALVVVTGLLGLLTMLLSGMNERRREMAILRSVGARPFHIAGLYISEALLLTFIGSAAGFVLFYVLLLTGRPYVESEFGLFITASPPSLWEAGLVAAILLAGGLTGTIAAVGAYRKSVADGLTVHT